MLFRSRDLPRSAIVTGIVCECTKKIYARSEPRIVWRGLFFHMELKDVEVAHVDYHLTRGTIELSAADPGVLADNIRCTPEMCEVSRSFPRQD